VSVFLAEIGTKLADRWLQALLVPGLLWTALLATGLHLGQRHPFALDQLGSWIDQLAARPAAHAPGTIVLTAVGTLLASAGTGLLAGVFGSVVEHLWALPGELPPASWLRRLRRRRWDAATRALETAVLHAAQPLIYGADPDQAAAVVRARQRRRSRLGPARPTHPTRIGDRFARTAARVARVNGLNDYGLVWPRLWTVLPEELRLDLAAARDSYTATTRLAAWGLLYAVLAVVWWPAALVGPTIFCAAVIRARVASAVVSDLIETAADLHITDLADRLGVATNVPALEAGRAITSRLRGSTPTT